MKPSRFLTELGPTDLVETMRIEEDLPHLTTGDGEHREGLPG